jgi:hypothetical protein
MSSRIARPTLVWVDRDEADAVKIAENGDFHW